MLDFHKIRGCVRKMKGEGLEITVDSLVKYILKEIHVDEAEVRRIIELANKTSEIKILRNGRVKIPTIRERISSAKELFSNDHKRKQKD